MHPSPFHLNVPQPQTLHRKHENLGMNLGSNVRILISHLKFVELNREWGNREPFPRRSFLLLFPPLIKIQSNAPKSIRFVAPSLGAFGTAEISSSFFCDGLSNSSPKSPIPPLTPPCLLSIFSFQFRATISRKRKKNLFSVRRIEEILHHCELRRTSDMKAAIPQDPIN